MQNSNSFEQYKGDISLENVLMIAELAQSELAKNSHEESVTKLLENDLVIVQKIAADLLNRKIESLTVEAAVEFIRYTSNNHKQMLIIDSEFDAFVLSNLESIFNQGKLTVEYDNLDVEVPRTEVTFNIDFELERTFYKKVKFNNNTYYHVASKNLKGYSYI